MAYTRHETTLSTGPVSYFKAGSGRPVLYLHSGTGPRFTDPLDRLGETHTVYMPIFPGFDGTPVHTTVKGTKALAQVFVEFLDKVINAKVDVIGHSIGGQVAAWVAVQAKDNIEQLVLVASGGFRPKDAPPIPSDPKELLKKAYAHPENMKPDGRTPEVSGKNREMAMHYVNGIQYDEELIGRLGEISALTLIVHGERDGVIPESAPLLLKRRIKKSHLIYLYDAAHVPEVDQPKRFTNLVGDFLTRGEAFIVNWGSRGPAGVFAPT
ncbi:MAG: alpha/beta hydrolase [Alphaproteobacteria bacterium]|nr:alpha/beta hydrolase [Alphaproteobacteria bacterium]